MSLGAILAKAVTVRSAVQQAPAALATSSRLPSSFLHKNIRGVNEKRWMTSKSGTITSADLADTIAEQHELSKAESKRIIDSLFNCIAEHCSKGNKVNISKFGAFDTATSAARTGRHPLTGAPLQIPSKERVRFRAFKSLKESVQKQT